jgi:Excalibur calcium-binding domain
MKIAKISIGLFLALCTFGIIPLVAGRRLFGIRKFGNLSGRAAGVGLWFGFWLVFSTAVAVNTHELRDAQNIATNTPKLKLDVTASPYVSANPPVSVDETDAYEDGNTRETALSKDIKLSDETAGVAISKPVAPEKLAIRHNSVNRIPVLVEQPQNSSEFAKLSTNNEGVSTSTVFVPGTCAQLQSLGLSDFEPGSPNYNAERDRDSDGIACESKKNGIDKPIIRNTAPKKEKSSEEPTFLKSKVQEGYIPGSCKYLQTLGLSDFTPGDPNYTDKRDRDKDGIACESR